MSSRELYSNLAAGALALGLLTAVPAVTWAQQPQAGALFELSTCSSCSAHQPVVAGDGAGGFLTAWNELDNLVSQTVAGRAFDARDTPLGGEFQLEPAAGGPPPQFDVAGATDARGHVVLAWVSIADGQSAIVAQRYDGTGQALGNPIEVAGDVASSASSPSDFKPAVAATPDGGFVVAWVNQPTDPADGTTPRVMARRYDAADAPLGAATQVSTGVTMGERPSVCVSVTGRVHVAWTYAAGYHPFEDNPAGIVVRRLSAGDVAIGPEQVISQAVDSSSSVAISCGPGNNFVVVWQTAQPPALSGSDIVAQRFSRRGRALGSPFLVNQLVGGEQKNPALSTAANGDFVVVWEGDPNGANGVRGRRFAASGAPLSDEFSVYRAGRGDLTVLRPAVAATGSNGFVVVVDAPRGVVGRQFSLAGGASATAAAAAPEVAAGTAGASTGNGRGAGGLW
jgi:large repetitive protein